MDAVKYFEEKKRMLNSIGRTNGECDSVDCRDCPLYFNSSGIEVSCGGLEVMHPELAIEIVEKWSQEHPRKTMLQDFLEKYPKAMLSEDGVPKYTCPHELGYCEEIYCHTNKGDCLVCWNRPLEE